MKKSKFYFVAIFAFALGLAVNHFVAVVEAAVLDPVLIVHQDTIDGHNGKVSVYLSHDPAVIAAVNATPDGGTSPNGDTKYLVGTPYQTIAVQTITDMLYNGLNNPLLAPH